MVNLGTDSPPSKKGRNRHENGALLVLLGFATKQPMLPFLGHIRNALFIK